MGDTCMGGCVFFSLPPRSVILCRLPVFGEQGQPTQNPASFFGNPDCPPGLESGPGPGSTAWSTGSQLPPSGWLAGWLGRVLGAGGRGGRDRLQRACGPRQSGPTGDRKLLAYPVDKGQPGSHNALQASTYLPQRKPGAPWFPVLAFWERVSHVGLPEGHSASQPECVYLLRQTFIHWMGSVGVVLPPSRGSQSAIPRQGHVLRSSSIFQGPSCVRTLGRRQWSVGPVWRSSSLSFSTYLCCLGNIWQARRGTGFSRAGYGPNLGIRACT